MALARPRRADTTSPIELSAPAAITFPDRRRRRSRLPTGLAAAGFAIGTVLADLLVVSLLAGSTVLGSSSRVTLIDPTSWWAAMVALRDPAVALASIAIGGLPGALAGHMAAVRRLRHDRLEAWLERSDVD